MSTRYDAVVVGAGPNGLAAAAVLARHGRSVLVLERAQTVGGGTRSAEITLPGFTHDLCSAVHPLAAASPLFERLSLARHGLEFVHAEVALAHPLDGGDAATLGPGDALDISTKWGRTFAPLVRDWAQLSEGLLGPMTRVPEHPIMMARFGMLALQDADRFRKNFPDQSHQALFTGNAAHAIADLRTATTAAFGLVLGAASYAVGMPVARGGSQAIANALAGAVVELGGEIQTGVEVRSLGDLPPSDMVLFDLTPDVFAGIAGDYLSSADRDSWANYVRGPGAFKLDYALDGPMPWTNEAVRAAGTVHVGGTADEIIAAESAVMRGQHPDKPFMIVAQQSVPDPSRAPAGKHTLWAYTHVPNGSTADVTETMERQLERFAPGFRDLVLARVQTTPADLHARNPNDVGGEISGGLTSGLRAVLRPRATLRPYHTPLQGMYLCSAATPPGAGVHGMSGYHAAMAALADHDRLVRRRNSR